MRNNQEGRQKKKKNNRGGGKERIANLEAFGHTVTRCAKSLDTTHPNTEMKRCPHKVAAVSPKGGSQNVVTCRGLEIFPLKGTGPSAVHAKKVSKTHERPCKTNSDKENHPKLQRHTLSGTKLDNRQGKEGNQWFQIPTGASNNKTPTDSWTKGGHLEVDDKHRRGKERKDV